MCYFKELREVAADMGFSDSSFSVADLAAALGMDPSSVSLRNLLMLGTYELDPPIRDKWLQLGGDDGVLGCPVSDTQDGIGGVRCNEFEKNGVIDGLIYSGPIGVFEIHGPIRAYWLDKGGPSTDWWYPFSDVTEFKCPAGEHCSKGYYSSFRGGNIYIIYSEYSELSHGPLLDYYEHPILDENGNVIQVYYGDGQKVHNVRQMILNGDSYGTPGYLEEGGPCGDIGYPIDEERCFEGLRYQHFHDSGHCKGKRYVIEPRGSSCGSWDLDLPPIFWTGD